MQTFYIIHTAAQLVLFFGLLNILAVFGLGATVISSPPRKLRSKNPKVALHLWQKLRKKIEKVALKLRAIWLIF